MGSKGEVAHFLELSKHPGKWFHKLERFSSFLFQSWAQAKAKHGCQIILCWVESSPKVPCRIVLLQVRYSTSPVIGDRCMASAHKEWVRPALNQSATSRG